MKKLILVGLVSLLPIAAFADCCGGGCGGGKCVWTMVAIGVGWWIVASTLLYLSWNHVVSHVTGWTKVKCWHALLIVATCAAFCAPKHFGKRHHGKCGGGDSKHCPYSKSESHPGGDGGGEHHAE